MDDFRGEGGGEGEEQEEGSCKGTETAAFDMSLKVIGDIWCLSLCLPGDRLPMLALDGAPTFC